MSGYMDRVPAIAEEDVRVLREKDAEYGGSWLRRGGVGAYMMAARKFDRLEVAAERHGWDILAAAYGDNRAEGVLDDIRDLRRYLTLIEAEILEREQTQRTTAAMRDPVDSETRISGSWGPTDAKRCVPRSVVSNVHHIPINSQDRPFGFDQGQDLRIDKDYVKSITIERKEYQHGDDDPEPRGMLLGHTPDQPRGFDLEQDLRIDKDYF